jgi:hypothetical protein
VILVNESGGLESRLGHLLRGLSDEVLIATAPDAVRQAPVVILRPREVFDTIMLPLDEYDTRPVKFEGTGRKPKRMHKRNRRRGRK